MQPGAGSGSAGRRQAAEFGSPGDAAGGGKGSHHASVRGTLSFKEEFLARGVPAAQIPGPVFCFNRSQIFF